MKTLLNETWLTLTALARREGVALSTIWRWTLRGVRGCRLETFSVGVKRFTTEESFIRFVEATTAATTGEATAAPQVRTSRQREAAIKRAEAELAKAGV